eukprot:CAMPEP_0118698656 /NCGR_PEP_ID=MMETSP0800-20121206/15347_1 /TAXON_ID=210618 ORGANISM="Striatella unipunctata, Strain CCMP2910" /NCGR_SAMPLE_ID=MMETSP0800 /ASSEMBLY_ACC=CAM_ASM_000638 /LENGTH=315 /DNA_ID=CAMNT_0006598551 /DNA_START=161 /DNA_END=1108 /DNA_ORIENTATION=-
MPTSIAPSPAPTPFEPFGCQPVDTIHPCNDSITSWDALRIAIASARPGATLNMCGSLTKSSSDNVIFILHKQIRLNCKQGPCLISGAGAHFDVRGTSVVTFQDFTFTGATQQSLHFESGTNHAICNCRFVRNKNSNAVERGAAIIAEEETSVTVENSEFEGNEASGGAAIFVNGGVVTVSDSTFTQNMASTRGAAISVDSLGKLELRTSSFTDNTSLRGGPIYTVGQNQVDDQGGNTGSANQASLGRNCDGITSVLFTCLDFVGQASDSSSSTVVSSGQEQISLITTRGQDEDEEESSSRFRLFPNGILGGRSNP